MDERTVEDRCGWVKWRMEENLGINKKMVIAFKCYFM